MSATSLSVRKTVSASDSSLDFRPLRRGVMVNTSEWGSAQLEARIRMRAHAVALQAQIPPVAFGTTAAALHGFPLIGVADDRVHVATAAVNPAKTRGDIVRHHVPLPPEDIDLVDGLLVTSVARTVFDVIRTLRLDGAVACMDAALRAVAWSDETRTVHEGRCEALRSDIRRRVAAAPGSRGIRTARIAVELADPRSQLPGESISRVRMWQLSMPTPERQMRVRTANGDVFPDFAWPALRRFGEFDGAVKLSDPRYTGGRTVDEILAAQVRRREDIESATGWRGLHWGWPELSDEATYGGALRSQGWPLHAMTQT
jgi:hypothetical protein